jgi:TPR repeat protein
MKSEAGSGKRARALELWRQASDGGNLEAQGRYGMTRFGDLMTTGTEPQLEAEYVTALSFLRLAARRGQPDAAGYVPGIASTEPTDGGGFHPPLEVPLADLPPEWVRSAFERADAELACYGPGTD